MSNPMADVYRYSVLKTLNPVSNPTVQVYRFWSYKTLNPMTIPMVSIPLSVLLLSR